MPEEMKKMPLVMYCTGGIRCEKFSAHMAKNLGFENLYQLDGGILRYIEQTGGAHWDGECFVFDRRVCLDENLDETEAELCFACREPLTPEEQKSPDYVVGKSCSYCI
jgi:predicted sulfurtransferase